MSRHYTYRIQILTRTRVLVEVQNPQKDLVAEPHGTLRYGSSTKRKIEGFHHNARVGNLSGDQVRAFGEALFDVLLDDTLRRDFFSFLIKAKQEKVPLRVELEIDDIELPDIAALPWEFIRIPPNGDFGGLWLATAPNIVLLRRRKLWDTPEPIEIDINERLRIALAVAAPRNLGPVKYQRISNTLIKLINESDDRLQQLDLLDRADTHTLDGLLEREPHVFHFIGHARLQNINGREFGEVALVDPVDGTAEWIEDQQFSEAFNRSLPRVVVLQACEGAALSSSVAFVGLASQLVQRNIPVVIAMQYEISNLTAQRFALKFYQRLIDGDPVDKAVQEARRHIALGRLRYNTRDFATPVIFMRVREGRLFRRPSIPSRFEKHTKEAKLLYPPLDRNWLAPTRGVSTELKLLDNSEKAKTREINEQPQVFDILESLQVENESIPHYVLDYLFPESGIMLGPGGGCPLWWLAQHGKFSELARVSKLIIKQLQQKRYGWDYADLYFRSLLWSKVLFSFADSQRGFTNQSLSTIADVQGAIYGMGNSEIQAWDSNIRSILTGKLGLEDQAKQWAAHSVFVAEAAGAFWLATVVRLRMLHRSDWHKWERDEYPEHSSFQEELAVSLRPIKFANSRAQSHIEALRSSVEVLHYSWSPSDSNRALDTANKALSLLSAQPDQVERARVISEIGRIKLFSLGDPAPAVADLKEGSVILASSGNLARLRYYLTWLAEAYLMMEDKSQSLLCAGAALFLHKKLYENTRTDRALVERITNLLSQVEPAVATDMKSRSLYEISNSLAESTGINPLWWFNTIFGSEFFDAR